MIDSFLSAHFCRFIGRVYLFLYYRNEEKVRLILAEKYNNSYAEAGTAFLFRAGVLVIVLLLIFGVIVLIRGVLFPK